MARPVRSRQLAQIHIAAQQLGLDDDAYRAMLYAVARVRSAKDLDEGGRNRVLDHLRACGWQPQAGKHRRQAPRTLNGGSRAEQMKKLEAQLATDGLPWSYAQAIALQMHRRERLEWCTSAELAAIIAALWQRKRKQLAQRVAPWGLHPGRRDDLQLLKEVAHRHQLSRDLQRLTVAELDTLVEGLRRELGEPGA